MNNSGVVPIRSITNLLSDDCRRIVDENAHKIGFSKAFQEMKFSIMTNAPKYNTRSAKSNILNLQQKQMLLLSEIFEHAVSAHERKNNERKQTGASKQSKKKLRPKQQKIKRSAKRANLRRSERLSAKALFEKKNPNVLIAWFYFYSIYYFYFIIYLIPNLIVYIFNEFSFRIIFVITNRYKTVTWMYL